MMKRKLLTVLSCLMVLVAVSQKPVDLINEKEALRIEQTLSSDEMKGRKTFSPEIDKAADFIAAEFKAAGLKTWKNSSSYLQPFELVSPKQSAISASLNGKTLADKDVVVITSRTDLDINNSSGYELKSVKKGDELVTITRAALGSGKNTVLLVDTSFAAIFPRLGRLKNNMVRSDASVVLILTPEQTGTYSIKATHDIKFNKLANVVGVLPGKKKANEYVIFSGHYDHIGVGKPVNGDSIYNGANDDAAGITSVILLARYYAALKDNERTIVFAAFTAEEVGGYGSQYFSKQFDPATVIAMFNIEMVGTESKWGTNSAYLTGYEKTDMGQILQKNLEGTGFTFHPDPYPDQQLFYRSDNATFARLGVPAHTISTSKMDSEPHYHKVSDEVSTLDMKNMAMVIRSIALSARSIVAGKDSPSRVKTEDLR